MGYEGTNIQPGTEISVLARTPRKVLGRGYGRQGAIRGIACLGVVKQAQQGKKERGAFHCAKALAVIEVSMDYREEWRRSVERDVDDHFWMCLDVPSGRMQ